MVAAEDFVWDAYLKIHPDAKCYKTKSLKHFDDLCVIYGYAVADGRYSLSSHDVIDDDVHGLNSGDGMGSIGVSNKEHSKTDWNASMDHYLIELLIDQLGRGNKVNKDFNKKAWTDMLDMFNAKFGTRHFKRVLKNRFRKLSKYYCEMREFLKRGFSWNEQKQMLSADDDVWDAYIKAHPHARTYRLKTLPNYRDLELIFKDMADDEISNLHQEKNNNDVTSEIKAGEGKGKGRRDSSGTDRTRTYWTPPMDRFLIDLLLEHVKSGNKLGQTFFTQAWNDMVTSFNEQFKSQYDKDVLKNRYKNLRKQFSDVDNVLCQSGFSWDDTREMVAAEDHVWDAYIKAHPEARSLRVKTLPGYHKLRVIFGVECSDTRYIRLSHYAQPLMIGEQNNGSLPSVRGSASKAEWPESLQCLFVDLMIEQVNSGNQNGYIFNEQAWTHMTEAFSAKLGLQCDKQFLLDQYFCLMKQHDDVINILHHSGFAWDETVSRIIADYDTWDAYIKDIPSAASYKNRSLYLYRDLCKIFGNKVSDIRASDLEHLLEMSDFTFEMDLDGTSGDFFGNTDTSVRDPDGPRGMDMDGNLFVDGNTEISYQNKERPNEIGVVGTSGKSDVISNDEVSNQYSERPRESGKDGTFANMVVTGNAQVLSRDKIRPNQMDMDGTCGTLATSGNTNVSDVVKKRPSTTPLDSRPSKKDMRMEEALSEMASAVKALMDKDEKNCDALLENAISALQAIPDIDDELVIDACDLLEDERMTKIFLALDTSLRKKWLLRKLRK
ncbi:hypothetical protein RIF29_12445 [Crotalaria pallida]|uniref:Myb/SANT-like domain-containing protein n=1 Tax=Crotalaria pallida TaxID=3830 RepID=A0AAN9INF0_CROPI